MDTDESSRESFLLNNNHNKNEFEQHNNKKTSKVNRRNKLPHANDDLYYEGNIIYKDDLDSNRSHNGSIKNGKNKIVKLHDYEGLKIERRPNSQVKTAKKS